MPHLKVNRKLEPFLTKHKPIKVAVGGRGSGKSIGFGDIMTMKMETEAADIYCLREFQDSVTDSVHRVFEDSITKRLKLEGWTVQENKVMAPNGAKTVYKGANRNPDAMQSAQGFKYSWFEEAHRATQASLDKLLPTIIRNPGAECWFSANPQSSIDPFSKRFITPYQKQLDKWGYYEDDLHLIVVVNWRDNPWWNEEQEILRAWDFDNLSRSKYDWIWEGKFNDSVENAIILPEWFDAAIDAHEKLGFQPRGAKRLAHDPADSGDARADCLIHGVVVLNIRENDKDDVNDSLDWSLNYAIEENVDLFTWDADGLGLGLKRQVNESLNGKRIGVHLFHGGAGVDNPNDVYEPVDVGSIKRQKTNRETFKNKRAQYAIKLKDRFYKTWRAVEKKEYIDPDELISISSSIENLDKVRGEVCKVPKKPNGAGLIQIMAKDEMKTKLKIDSPNMFDSLMMSQVMPETEDWGKPIQYRNLNRYA